MILTIEENVQLVAPKQHFELFVVSHGTRRGFYLLHQGLEPLFRFLR